MLTCETPKSDLQMFIPLEVDPQFKTVVMQTQNMLQITPWFNSFSPKGPLFI